MEALTRAQRKVGELELLIEVLEEVIDTQKEKLELLGGFIEANATDLENLAAQRESEKLAATRAEEAALDD